MIAGKVLVVHNAYVERGGEDAVVDCEVGMLRRRGHDVRELRLHNELIRGRARLGIAIDTVWARSSHRLVGETVTQFGPDIVHFHNTFPLISPAGYWAAAGRRVPTVQTLHNFRLLCPGALLLRDGGVCEDCVGKVPWRAAVHRCYRDSTAGSGVVATMLVVHRVLGTFHSKVTRYIAFNEFCRDKFIEGGLPGDRIDIKPNFVDAPAPSDGPRKGILFVGRLSEEKGTTALLSALNLAPDITIDVVGSGPDEVRFRAHPRVRMIGWREPAEVRRRMMEAEMLVVPSIWYETFGMVAVEAFACGLAVVASRVGALASLIRHGETGVLFEPGSAESLVNALRWGLDHREEMRAMGRNARKEYERKYTPDTNYSLLCEIYERAMLQGRTS